MEGPVAIGAAVGSRQAKLSSKYVDEPPPLWCAQFSFGGEKITGDGLHFIQRADAELLGEIGVVDRLHQPLLQAGQPDKPRRSRNERLPAPNGSRLNTLREQSAICSKTTIRTRRPLEDT